MEYVDIAGRSSTRGLHYNQNQIFNLNTRNYIAVGK